MTNRKPIFCVLGRSASGKDTLVSAVCKDTGLKQVCSYTTRAKRINEGATHLFISEEEAAQKKDIIAETKINGYRYFVTQSQLDDRDFYIIDPKGLNDLRSNRQLCEQYRFVAIYVTIPEELRSERIKTRGDDPEVAKSRLASEKAQFDDFEASRGWDYRIANISLEDAKYQLEAIIREVMDCTNESITKLISNL